MGSTIFAEGDTCVGRCELYVGVAVGDFLAHLVIDAAGHELCEAAAERNLAGDCEARRDADHIGLGDAALDESFGELRCEGIHLQGAFKVGRKGQHVGILAACDHETVAESAAGIFLSGIYILLHTSNLLRFL